MQQQSDQYLEDQALALKVQQAQLQAQLAEDEAKRDALFAATPGFAQPLPFPPPAPVFPPPPPPSPPAPPLPPPPHP